MRVALEGPVPVMITIGSRQARPKSRWPWHRGIEMWSKWAARTPLFWDVIAREFLQIIRYLIPVRLGLCVDMHRWANPGIVIQCRGRNDINIAGGHVTQRRATGLAKTTLKTLVRFGQKLCYVILPLGYPKITGFAGQYRRKHARRLAAS